MYFTAQVTEGIHWVGANDREVHLFERIWPLPHGVAYNSYLICDEKNALIDTIAEGSDSRFIARIQELLKGQPLHYLVINHMEPDHSGDIRDILQIYPQLQILGNKRTKQILDTYYPGLAHFHEVQDGESVSLGKKALQFHYTPWVHWPETMMTYETSTKTLFAGDAFGSFAAFDGAIFDDEMDATRYEDEMLRYYSNIVGKYSKMVQRALAKLADVPIGIIAPAHGPVWRENPRWVIERYDTWSQQKGEHGIVIVTASMYGHTMALGDYIARQLAVNGVKRIIFHDVSRSHISEIIRDVWRYKGLILGSVSYNTGMFPLMAHLCQELEHLGLQNKFLAIFGGASWSGGGVRTLAQFAENSKLPLVCDPVEMMGFANETVLQQCENLAKAMAKALLEKKEC